MCPLRFILVFLSAALAAVLAWKSIRSSPPSLVSDDSREIDTPRGDSSINARIFRAGKAIENGFWVFLDMASGRYLWRAMKERVDEIIGDHLHFRLPLWGVSSPLGEASDSTKHSIHLVHVEQSFSHNCISRPRE
ncbi:hypothetical protein MUK42_15055 [Musa troglodytarum]|uniref:Methyltransferase n=1 Tax=Musa troglodytarum TaxID=320322 RepID=A0A9E7LA67_9LILI|nr:hypothetical protein MUK42_15055 [Musa troglodytarum]